VNPLAIFHSHVQIISRGSGKSAVAAAYRAGETITNEKDGVTHDYTRKGGIVHTEILLSGHAPAEYADRAVLWNAVEKIEKAENAQLARELDIALPIELTREQGIALAREYVQKTFVSAGMCADLCVHDTGEGNPHFHVMLTMRPINEGGTWGGKQKKEYTLDRDGNKIYDPKKRQYKCRSIPSTDWNDRGNADKWRKAWEDMANAELKRIGSDARIDRRSYEEQGIEQVPTVHMGVAASQMERKGIRTERGDQNRAIAIKNQQLAQQRARIRKIKDWIISQPIQDAPTMGEMLSAINNAQNMKSQWQKIRDLQLAANVLIFIQRNGIGDPAQLADKITELHQRHYDLANNVKAKERRISKLNEHLAQVDIFNRHKAMYDKGKKITDPKKRKAYADKHADELAEYNSALAYLKQHLNGYGKIPEKEWRNEQKRLLAERYTLVDEYYKLNDDVKNVEALRRGAEKLMRDVTPERTPQKSRGVEI
jgi:hypothetical protein